MDVTKFASDYKIFECLAGSRSYGTNTPTSDTDTRGIFIAPPEFILGCMYNVEQVLDDKQDTQIYELAKFTRLAKDCNPNIIELLFTDPENVLFCDPVYKHYINNRHLFLSKKAKFTFSGYAIAQLKRIKGHNKWITNEQPEEAPKLTQYIRVIGANGLENKEHKEHKTDQGAFLNQNYFATKFNEHVFKLYRTYNPEKFRPGIFSSDLHQIKFIDIDAEKISQATEDINFSGFLFVALEEFNLAHKNWVSYWTWKRERNETRAALEKNHGYDTKHAMHLVRLMRMCEEILTDGVVHVKRPDAQELLAIRNGAWSYEELIKWAESQDQKMNALYETSSLPHTADIKAINDLYMQTTEEFWAKRGLLNLKETP